MDPDKIKSEYPELLRKYLFEDDKEVALYRAYNLGQECFEAKISIDEIMSLHARSLENILKDLPPSFPSVKIQEIMLKSSNLLLEFSIKFGLICQNYFEMLKMTDERIRNAFYQAAKALTAGMDLQKMLSVILNLVKNITDAEGSAIILLDEERVSVKVSEGFDTEEDLLKDPLYEEVAKEGKAKFVYDMREKKTSFTLKSGKEIRSVLVLPLNYKEKTLGVLAIFLIYPHNYAEEEIKLLTSFTYEVASAIDNAHLFEELKRHDKTLEALYAIGTAVGKSLDLRDIFKDALFKTLEVTETESGGIYLLEKDGKTLSLRSYIGISDEFADAISKLKVGQGSTGMAVKTGKPITYNVSKYPSPEILPLLLKEGIVSIASTPLIAKGRVVGALTLAYRKYRIFTNDDLDLLASIGTQIGVAIENSRLFSELEQHHKILRTLFSIESVVSRSLNLEEVFEVALSKTLEATDTEAGTLYSYDGDVLHLEAYKGLSSEFREKAKIRKMGEGIPGKAAQIKKALTVDIHQFPSHFLLPYVKKEGLNSFIGTPLMSKGKVVGAMAFGTKEKRIFTQEELDLLFSIGNVIGIAVENARLYKESKESLQKLEQTYEELKALDKMKDEFISNVSHELKTPLISIKGYGELLFDEKLGTLSEEQKKSLEAIVRNADRLTRLINSILFITRLQAGKVEFKFEPLDVDEIITNCLQDFKGTLERKNISFEKDISKISRIMGDKDRFIEVVSNLLDNAVKFTPDGGNISIKVYDEADMVHLVFSDSGIGIPEDIIPKLFTRFYQVDASTARRYGGTGLGLYIAKNIVDAFNGKIWIESEIGRGTKVHMLLPVATEEGEKR